MTPPSQHAIGNNPGRSRSHNRRVVLEAVRLHGPLGRTDIARIAHLTAQAVSNIVGELLAEGLLVEDGRRRSGRGQPPIQFAVNPDGGVTLGIEIGAHRLTTLAVDLAGRLRAQRERPIAATDPAHVLPLIVEEVAAIRATGSIRRSALLGVGVVMPGPFGVDGLIAGGPTTLGGWDGLDPAALIEAALAEAELGEPVLLGNDATAAAVGERLHGAARSLRNFCHLYFGQGLGLGIMIDGRPFGGAFGNAGEIGHVVVEAGGRACACGNRGCLEQYASLQALEEQLAAAGIGAVDSDAIDRLHREGHPVVTGWIADAAARLAPQIVTLENLFDPEAIVFGGILPEGVIAALIAALDPLPTSVAGRRHRGVPRVIAGTTGRLTAALGGAALPLLETMTPKLDRTPPPEVVG
ncbi:putative NBD/HSP70 family sugar kinase [Azospirillum agricola]|uniref:ROK family transcriptional regulator n=1 Tax=Azospirillum agricola TaxID=1720247 RepID=UPI001AE14DB9|nr:ROK family transcriptional regulator [Azospirillum agricola]MBP2230917.1 putative NBD/HSP70 family sugar kinase [Azospirillum agricola]